MFNRLRLEDPVFGSGKGAFDKGIWKLMHTAETLVGLWPFHSGCQVFMIRIYSYSSILFLIVPLVIRLFEEIGHDITIVVENFVGTMYLMTAILKFASGHYSLDKKKILFKQIKDNYESEIDNEEHEIVNEHEYSGCKLAILYIAIVISAVTLFNCVPLCQPFITDLLFPNSKSNVSSGHRVLPYHAEYFIDQEKYFYVLITKDLICATTGVIVVFTHDLGYILSGYHVSGLFAVIESVDLVEQCYSNCWFLVLLVNMVLLGSGLVVVTMKLGNYPELFRYGLMFCSAFIHFYVIFSPGQKIINGSLEIFDACYDCEWYKLSRISVTLLQVMMLRSIKRCTITGGKMFILCMETYSSMMKTGLSYFTVFSV